MDREDARFVANALESRISGARVDLEQLAASSLVRLYAAAAVIDGRNPPPGRWPPATAASETLRSIARVGGMLADEPLADGEAHDLGKFVALMRDLAAEEQRPFNRRERRAQAKIQLPRRQRLMGVGKPLIGIQ